MVGAVNVDVARVTIAAITAVTARLQPTQADDPSGDQVALLILLGGFREMLARRHPPFKHHTQWFVVAELVAQCMQPQRGAIGIGKARGRILRGGNRKYALQRTVADERKFLSFNRND